MARETTGRDVWAELAAVTAELRALLDQCEAEDGHRLECVECRRRSVGAARGWMLRLDVDGDLAAFCPSCDEREFGDAA